MVSVGVSRECVEFLRGQFDNVIEAPLISHEVVPMKSEKQRKIYGQWIHNSFTKWNILDPRLFPVEKVILVDADMIFHHNCDDLFDLAAPALTFSSPWAWPYQIPGAHNPYWIGRRPGGRELQHGEEVSHEAISRGLKNGILGLACMVLVSPDAVLFDNMLKILGSASKYGSRECVSGFDEQLIAETFVVSRIPVYNIHQSYNWIVGKHKWLPAGAIPRCQQYYNGKPWDAPRERTEWPDVIEWWDIADQIISDAPSVKKWFYLKIGDTQPLPLPPDTANGSGKPARSVMTQQGAARPTSQKI
jgi:hypothetical protein